VQIDPLSRAGNTWGRRAELIRRWKGFDLHLLDFYGDAPALIRFAKALSGSCSISWS